MDAQQFANGYRRTLSTNEIYNYDMSSPIKPAQDWSYQFGTLMHEILSSEQPQAMSPADFSRYHQWALSDLGQLSTGLLDIPVQQALRARNELNFHVLTSQMLGLWLPLLNGKWASKAERLQRITAAQDSLALEGLGHYAMRQQVVDKHGGHTFFDTEENRQANGRHVGVVQEVDAAIVLLDVMRHHPNLTIVPAPLQFERSRHKNRNVDFIAVDFLGAKAVGVQVRTNVTKEMYKEVDKDRVVFIDGTVDLGNVRVLRTVKGSSSERVVPWPGIIAAKRVDGIKTHGKYAPRLRGKGNGSRDISRDIVLQKLIAREQVGNIRVDYEALSQKIGERILNKL